MPTADPKTGGRSTLRARKWCNRRARGRAAAADRLQHQRLRQPGQLAADGGHRRHLRARPQDLGPGRARRYLWMPGCPQAARQAVTEMHRQVGSLRLGQDGLARRGLLVRHLVMPGMLEETGAILRYVATELGTETYVNLMAQYHPAGLVGCTHRDGYHEIARQLARDEYELAIEYADHLGLRRLDQRSRAAPCNCRRHRPRRAACQPPARTPGSGRQRLERRGGWPGPMPGFCASPSARTTVMGAREAGAAPRTGAILPARRAGAATCHRAQSIDYDNVREIRRYGGKSERRSGCAICPCKECSARPIHAQVSCRCCIAPGQVGMSCSLLVNRSPSPMTHPANLPTRHLPEGPGRAEANSGVAATNRREGHQRSAERMPSPITSGCALSPSCRVPSERQSSG